MDIREPLELADIPGLGPVRLQALAEVGVRDLEGLLALKVRELAEIRGIGLWQARKIREHLRQRGLLVGVEEDGAMVLVPPRTAAQEAALERSVQVIEAQAEAEARVAAEVQALARAVEAAHHRDDGAEKPHASAQAEAEAGAGEPIAASNGAAAEPEQSAPGANGKATGEPASPKPEDEEPEKPDWRQEVMTQREQLPEAALQLIESIRQASVAQQLTRQLTRLLITAGEFADGGRSMPDERRRKASQALAETGRLLERAQQRGAYSLDEQKELAKRIRRLRKDLEGLLEKE